MTTGQVYDANLRMLAELLSVVSTSLCLGWRDDGTEPAGLDALRPTLWAAEEAVSEALNAVQRFGYRRTVFTTDGQSLRAAAELADRINYACDVHEGDEGIVDDAGRRMTAEELFPHLLRERNERSQRCCPLCGGEREESVGHDEGIELRAWCCWACNGDVRKAKRILKGKRVNLLAKRDRKARKAKATPKSTAADHIPAVGYLPVLGVLDCRTPAEREADEAAGKAWGDVAAEVLAGTAEPLAPAPRLANRITGIA